MPLRKEEREMREVKDFFLKTKGETVLRLPEYMVMATVLSPNKVTESWKTKAVRCY